MNSSCIFVPYLQSLIITNRRLIAQGSIQTDHISFPKSFHAKRSGTSASKDESRSSPSTMLPSRSTGTFINTFLLNSEYKRKRSLLFKCIHSSFLFLCLQIFCDQTHLLPQTETKIHPAQYKSVDFSRCKQMGLLLPNEGMLWAVLYKAQCCKINLEICYWSLNFTTIRSTCGYLFCSVLQVHVAKGSKGLDWDQCPDQCSKSDLYIHLLSTKQPSSLLVSPWQGA